MCSKNEEFVKGNLELIKEFQNQQELLNEFQVPLYKLFILGTQIEFNNIHLITEAFLIN